MLCIDTIVIGSRGRMSNIEALGVTMKRLVKEPDQFEVGPVLAAPSVESGEYGKLNAGCYRFADGSKFYAIRVNTAPPDGKGPDETGWIECMLIAPNGEKINSFKLFERGKLPSPFEQVEDIRIYGKKGEKELMLLMTGIQMIDKKKKKYLTLPTISVIKFPFRQEDASPPQIIEGLPPGKNVLINEEYTDLYKGAYRQSGSKFKRSFTTFSCWQDSEGNWKGKILETQKIPKRSWVRDYAGLTGGTKIPVNGNGDFILLLHAANMEKKTKEANLGEKWYKKNLKNLLEILALKKVDKKPVYLIFPGLFNKKWKLERIGEPVLTYLGVKQACTEEPCPRYHNGAKDAIYACHYDLMEKEKAVKMPLTIDDSHIRETIIPLGVIYHSLGITA